MKRFMIHVIKFSEKKLEHQISVCAVMISLKIMTAHAHIGWPDEIAGNMKNNTFHFHTFSFLNVSEFCMVFRL